MGLNPTIFTELICQMCTKQFCNKQATLNCVSRLHLLWSQQQTNKRAGMASMQTDLWDLSLSYCVWQGTRKSMFSGQIVVSSGMLHSIVGLMIPDISNKCTGFFFKGWEGLRIPSKHLKSMTQQHSETPQTSWILKSTFTYTERQKCLKNKCKFYFSALCSAQQFLT